MKNSFILLLIAIIAIFTTQSLAINLSTTHNKLFTPHPCRNLKIICFTNKGQHLIGEIQITQLPRMVRDKIVCLPEGHFYNRHFVKKMIKQCNKTYPFSCKKHGGCSPRFLLSNP